jgi:hypothetical protein
VLVAAATFALAACGARGPAAAEVKASAAPHLGAFVDFDPWARRAALGDPAFPDDRAFLEAAFAPLREQRGVANAWIERRGTHARTLAMHPEISEPPNATWVPVRHDELGAIEVAQAALPPRGPPGTSGVERACVLIAHKDTIEDGAVVRVVVAYLLAPQ